MFGIEWSTFSQILVRSLLLCCSRLFQIGVTKRGCCETHQDHRWIFRSRCPGYQKSPKSAHYRRVQFGLQQAYKQLVIDQMKLNKLAEPDKVFAIKSNKIVDLRYKRARTCWHCNCIDSYFVNSFCYYILKGPYLAGMVLTVYKRVLASRLTL